MSRETQLHSAIEKSAPFWIDFLQQLIKTPSYSGDEAACQKLVTQAMQDLGIFAKHIYYQDIDNLYPDRDYADRPNVVGLKPGTTTKNFILNAHIDTARVENEASWQFPPFAGMISDGKCFGRGALDDKAGIAMLLMLAEVLQATDLRLPCNVYFESVIEDEDTGNGTKALTEAGLYADAALVIDGTWPFRMIDAHLGQLWLEFTISGQPVAACSCKRGINPIQIAAKLLALFNQYITDKNNGYSRDSHPHWHNIDAPYFISPGVIQAGNWPGATPETCRLVCQFGFPEPDTTTTLLADIDTLFNRLSREEHELVHGSVKGLKTNPFANRNNLLVRLLTDNIKRLRAGEMEPVNVAVTGHCDLRHLKKQNGKPADACLYGPGGGGNPHVKNEFYRLDHFVPVAQNIISTLLGWCAG